MEIKRAECDEDEVEGKVRSRNVKWRKWGRKEEGQ